MDVRVRLGRLGPGEVLQLLCSPQQWSKILLLIDSDRFETSADTDEDPVRAAVRLWPRGSCRE